MEVFVDFGLFEFMAAVGAASLARRIYARKMVGMGFLIASIIAPLSLVFLCRTATTRWVAASCLAMCLVNVGAIAAILQHGQVPQLRAPIPFQVIAKLLKRNVHENPDV